MQWPEDVDAGGRSAAAHREPVGVSSTFPPSPQHADCGGCTIRTTVPTWEKYRLMHNAVDNLRVKDKRRLFMLLRTTQDLDPSTFFPEYGLTAGEFAVLQVLTENGRKSARDKRKQ